MGVPMYEKTRGVHRKPLVIKDCYSIETMYNIYSTFYIVTFSNDDINLNILISV